MIIPMSHLLKISGPDAATFLQGQVTCDLSAVSHNICHLGAHCHRFGRMISLFNIFLHEDQKGQHYLLCMPEAMIAITIGALKKYTPFFKVTMEAVPAISIPPFPYPERPMLYPETSGQFLPHDFQLQHTHAISFTKGCYTGQE